MYLDKSVYEIFDMTTRDSLELYVIKNSSDMIKSINVNYSSDYYVTLWISNDYCYRETHVTLVKNSNRIDKMVNWTTEGDSVVHTEYNRSTGETEEIEKYY